MSRVGDDVNPVRAGLSGVARRNSWAANLFDSSRAGWCRSSVRRTRQLPREPGQATIQPAGNRRLPEVADAQPTRGAAMSAQPAGLCWAPAPGWNPRADLRDACGSDVTCRSADGGPPDPRMPGRARCPCFPVTRAPLLAAARFAGPADLRHATQPRNLVNR